MTKSRGIVPPRKHWTAAEDKVFRKLYPRIHNRELAARFGCSVNAINSRSTVLRVHKDADWLDKVNRANGEHLHRSGFSHRFPKGHIPANKGLRRPGYSIGRGRMRETQFKKGQMPHTTVPVGTLVRVNGGNADGYYKRKVAESAGPGLSRFGWKQEHVRIWEEKHGPVPAGHAVVFKDRNKEHITLRNLELVTRQELMRRNTIHARRTPEQKRAIYALMALKRKISKLEGKWQTTSRKSAASYSKRCGSYRTRRSQTRPISSARKQSPTSRRRSSIPRRSKSER